MSGIEIAQTVLAMETENALLKKQISGMVDTSRFYAVALTAEEVAKLHGVSARRVRDYANRGLLPLHPSSTDGKMLFRASEALVFDIKEVRREKRRESLFQRQA